MLSEVNPRSAKVGLKALVRPWVCTFYYFANVTREEETAVHQEPPDGQCHLWDIRERNSKTELKALAGLLLTVEIEQIEMYSAKW